MEPCPLRPQLVDPLHFHFAQAALPHHYSLQKLIGTGSYGVVARATRSLNSSAENVAIKKVKNLFKDIPNAKRYLREISLLQRLHHPSLVKIVEILPPKDPHSFNQLYIVTEYCQSDLRKTMAKINRTLRHQDIAFIAYQITQGMNYLHESCIMHRDLKPSNILINQDKTIKICDFGLSRSTKGVQKPWYQLRNQVNEQSDRIFPFDETLDVLKNQETSLPNQTTNQEQVSRTEKQNKSSSSITSITPLSEDHLSTSDTLTSEKKPKKPVLQRESRTKKINISKSAQNSPTPTLPSLSLIPQVYSKGNLSRQVSYSIMTRWYRAPEVILMENYTYAIDIWSLGCIFAELLDLLESPEDSKKQPLFCGKNHSLRNSPKRETAEQSDPEATFEAQRRQQLNNIFDIIGTPSEEETEWIAEPSAVQYLKSFEERHALNLRDRFKKSSEQAIDLLSKMLVFDPRKRLTTKQILEHPYFKQKSSQIQKYNLISKPPAFHIELEFEREDLDEQKLRSLFLQEIGIGVCRPAAQH